MQALNVPGQAPTIKPHGRTAVVTIEVPGIKNNVGVEKEQKLQTGAFRSHVKEEKWAPIRIPARRRGYSSL